MLPENDSERSSLTSLERQLDIAHPPPGADLHELQERLADRIAELLDHQPSRLMSHLYRIDVKESAVQKILASAPPTEVPWLLAGLMIDRELEKVKTRRTYRRSG